VSDLLPRFLRLVLVEDNPGDARLIREYLAEAGAEPPVLEHFERLEEALLRLISPGVSCVLLDLSLPDARGLDALIRARKVAPEVPIVVVTGRADQALGIEALQEGAQDYLVKDQLSPGGIARSIRFAIERKQTEVQVAYRALHDPLTGLPNRRLLLDRMAHSLTRLDRTRASVAVLFVDFDRFKLVNDSFGHEVGDRVLVEASTRLSAIIRPADTLARLGGDEFILLCEDVEGGGHASNIARRIHNALAVPIVVGMHQIRLSVSIGIALGTSSADSASALLRDADAAMYHAKAMGGGRFEVFDEVMRSRAAVRLATEQALRHALERRELRLHYQPVVSLATGRLTGVEGLVRWAHPQRGLVPPLEFIPLAEETGLIQSVGQWVIEEACAQAERWRLAYPAHAPGTMSVNLSPLQLVRSDLVEIVGSALRRTGTDAGGLCLEMTESVVMEDARAVSGAITALGAMGVRLAVDDFGTGYSSLRSLRRFPVNLLKIDRSFVGGLGHSADDASIVEAVQSLADALNLDTIAEGIETERQVETLRALGCKSGQGYYFAHPQPPAAVTGLFGRILPVRVD
jgi:diguanylate cyclase (GGDEF)-like protein